MSRNMHYGRHEQHAGMEGSVMRMRGCSAGGMQGLPCTCKGGSHGGGGEGEGGGGEGDGGGGLGLGGGDGDGGGGGEGVGGGRGLGRGLCTLQGWQGCTDQQGASVCNALTAPNAW